MTPTRTGAERGAGRPMVMDRAIAAVLPDGRLHLHHGPIDCLITTEGEATDVATARAAAARRFRTILPNLCAELPALRQPLGDASFAGLTAQRMAGAVARHEGFITPMAAVAGAVADEVLDALTAAAPLDRAFVNNGGDIAVHLKCGQSARTRIAGPNNVTLGQITLTAGGPLGIATSGHGGRSLSMGIADSVTVLAETAAEADAAATLIANAVDIDHPAITRAPAQEVQTDSDLGERPVVVSVGPLGTAQICEALDAGTAAAHAMVDCGLIAAAALFLKGESRAVHLPDLSP